LTSATARARGGSWAKATALRPAIIMGLGLVLIAYLAGRTDPRQLLRALAHSGAWLPLLAALEAMLLVSDTAAFATLITPASPIPARAWLRSSAASYLCLVLLPAGRTLGEAARAALAAPYSGVERAAIAGAQLQAVALLADGIVSLAAACVTFAALGRQQHLAEVLFGNCWLVSLAGAALLCVVRAPNAIRRLLRNFPRLSRYLPDRSSSRSPAWRAIAWSMFGRALQVLQYGIAILAVGGAFSMQSAFIAHGVHMVGATVGVAMPNQLGVADGAYLVFARALGFGHEPARALAAILAVRLAQLLLALVCLSVVLLSRQRPHSPAAC
jgi:hypothetical protein